jgi:hypothetical protein
LDAGARGDAAEAARVTGDAAAAARGAPARRGRGARPAPVSRCVLVCLFLGGVSLAVFLLPVLTLAFVAQLGAPCSSLSLTRSPGLVGDLTVVDATLRPASSIMMVPAQRGALPCPAPASFWFLAYLAFVVSYLPD